MAMAPGCPASLEPRAACSVRRRKLPSSIFRPPTGTVSADTLRRLASEPAVFPLAARGYLTLVLDLPWGGFTRLVALTAQFEAAGKFTAQNRNHDHAGV